MSIASVIMFCDPCADLGEAALACIRAFESNGVSVVRFSDADAPISRLEGRGVSWAFVTDENQMRAALSGGFFTCAVLPEGVACPTGLLARADIVCHGWPEVSFALLDDYARADETAGALGACRVLIVAGSPQPSSAQLVSSLADEADYVVACDAGARVCRAAGMVPDAFVGDGDSAGRDVLSWVRSTTARLIAFPPEKYATDLALSIDAARHEAARRKTRLELVLTCASGGRPDHALAALGQLLAAQDAAPRLVEDDFELRILSPQGMWSWQLDESAKDRVLSVVALLPGTVVSERGMRWDLDHRNLPVLGDEGISNVVASTSAHVECHSGACVVYLLHA